MKYNMLTITEREAGQLKTLSPIDCIKDDWKIMDIILDTHRDNIHEKVW